MRPHLHFSINASLRSTILPLRRRSFLLRLVLLMKLPFSQPSLRTHGPFRSQMVLHGIQLFAEWPPTFIAEMQTTTTSSFLTPTPVVHMTSFSVVPATTQLTQCGTHSFGVVKETTPLITIAKDQSSTAVPEQTRAPTENRLVHTSRLAITTVAPQHLKQRCQLLTTQ